MRSRQQIAAKAKLEYAVMPRFHREPTTQDRRAVVDWLAGFGKLVVDAFEIVMHGAFLRGRVGCDRQAALE